MTDKPKKGRWTYYSVSDEKLDCAKKSCPRCGSGVCLAVHKDRLSCGKCGYTEFGNNSQGQGQKSQGPGQKPDKKAGNQESK